MIGGYSNDRDRENLQPQHCLLNLDTFEWELLRPDVDVVECVTSLSATLVDDRILMLGGFNESILRYFPAFNIRWFDPVMNSVTVATAKGDIPTSRYRHIAGFFEHRREVIIFGGKERNTPLPDLYSLNVDAMEFTSLTHKGRAPPPQSSHFACMQGHVMFVFCNNGLEGDFELWLLEYWRSKPQWSLTTKAGEIPREVYGGSMNYYDNKLIVYGGVVNGAVQKNLYVYDLKAQIWTDLTEAYEGEKNGIVRKTDVSPGLLARQIGISLGSRIVMIGGSSTRLDDTWELLIS